MNRRDIIVIGASAGGLEPIKKIITELPPDFAASVFVVWHMAPDAFGYLPQILNRLGSMTAANAYDGEMIQPARIYVAPPDHHLVIDGPQIRVTKGPKENRFRPAVDPLFRSASLSYGSRVLGVILSGSLDDGTAGLWKVKEMGGVAIVQHLEDAEVLGMPKSAIRNVDVDYVVPADEIATLLISLVATEVAEEAVSKTAGQRNELAKSEIEVAMGDVEAGKDIVLQMGDLSPFTCPECHGVLTRLTEGRITRYRCHTGHAFSSESLLASLSENIEETLWTAMRGIQESTMLLNHMGDHFASVNQPRLAAAYFLKAKEAEARVLEIRATLNRHELLNSENIADLT